LQNEDAPAPHAIEVEFGPFDGSGFSARVRLCGEHDLATSREVVDALAPLDGNVLVDLSACEFIDSTIIAALLNDAQGRAREGKRLELLVPPENRTVLRTLEVSGVIDLVPVHTASPWL
jgi:anti-anti-sigma factor